MKSSVFIATALFGSAPLVFGRPQDTQLQIEDLTSEFDTSLSTDPNANIIPPPAPFVPSPLSSIQNFPKLAFISGAVPDITPQTNAPVKSTEVSTDYGYTQIPRDDTVPKSFKLLTKAVRMVVDSIINEESTYGIFGVSEDGSKLVPDLISTDKSWDSFGQDVRKSRPSFALHLTDDGMLLIFTYQNMGDDSSSQQVYSLSGQMKYFVLFIQKEIKKKGTGSRKLDYKVVNNDYSLQAVINSYDPAVYFHDQ
ncbi:hypothetical protein MMC22_004109 [Lobaria immixta]|nr:hypothetical protein [Lobaria immixta]